jgi:D-apionolactonase
MPAEDSLPDSTGNVVSLRTRSFSCLFEAETGYLRRVETATAEIVRAIYGAVRDQNWNTINPRLVIETLKHDEDSFLLEFTARCERVPISFWWRGTILGSANRLEFRFDGRSRSTFLRNRIGLCVLHPIAECAGKACLVQHTGGSWHDAAFPLSIAPHQPFRDLAALKWSPSDRIAAEIRFEGDVFETEDQRNWTDASFKTYCTPLERPYPVEVAIGEEVHQRVVLNLGGDVGSVRASSESRLMLRIDCAALSARPLPKLGLAVASHGSPLSSAERRRLANLRLNHLRVDLRLLGSDWEIALPNARDEALSIGARLQCALFLSDSAASELERFQKVGDPSMTDLCLIFHEREKSTSSHWFDFANQLLGPAGFRLATGTNAYFAELNRRRPARDVNVCYSLNPQVHAFDDLSLMETLEAQPATVYSAMEFCDRNLVISPITLRPRFNPNATVAEQEPENELPSRVDRRQRTLFGAAWTVGTLSRLLPIERIDSLTFYETTGWAGLMETELGCPLPELFGSEPGEIFPVYYVFAALSGARHLLPTSVSDPRVLAAVTVRTHLGRSVCVLANLTPERLTVTVEVSAPTLLLRVIEDANLSRIRRGERPESTEKPLKEGRARLDLASYAVAMLEF